MEERPFGQRSGFHVPPVNIGAMRLPRDVDDAVTLIRHAIDSGLKYIDTSRGYGESEWLLGQALQDGYREKVILSTKCCPWILKVRPQDEPSADCTRRRIDESMRRLGVDYLDFYQVWNIDSREHYDAAVRKGGMVEGILNARDEGLVRHTGFTTHDSVENISVYIDEADWCEVILFTYNLINRRYAPVIEKAHNKGIGTLVMNPVGGGRLAGPSPVLLKLAEEVGAVSVPDLAVRYVLSNPNVDTILCGMQKEPDVDDSVASAERPPLDDGQMARIDEFLDDIAARKEAFCTGCRYCLPCPQGIDIPAMMNIVFDDRVWGMHELSKRAYRGMTGAKAEACTQCGACEKACTQNLSIMEMMSYAAQAYAEDKPAG